MKSEFAGGAARAFPEDKGEGVGPAAMRVLGEAEFTENVSPFPTAPRTTGGPAALSRLRYQAPLVASFSAVLPALVLGEPRFWAITSLSSASNAFAGVFACAILSLFLFRRLGTFPGITSFGQVVPSVAFPYFTALAAILVSRSDYSRPLFLTSLAASAVLFSALWLYYRRRCSSIVYVVPGSRLEVGARAKVATLGQPISHFQRGAVIAADLDADLAPEWERFLLNSALGGVPVYHVKQLQESITGKVAVEHLSENTFGSVMPNIAYLKLKRALDVFGVLLAAPLVLPLMTVIALLIKLDSKGSIFFIQERMGSRGIPFLMVKFRTMNNLRTSECAREAAKTMTGDARVTKIGRFLRRSRLDELPQIFNILKGEMSWIGPRPEATSLSAWYHAEIPYYGYRHIVRPGITGWAQVNQGHVVEVGDVRDKLYYDFYYIKYFSGWLDLLIALRTMRTLISGTGAK